MVSKELKEEVLRLIEKAYKEKDVLTLITVSLTLLSEISNKDFEEKIKAIMKQIGKEDIELIRERLTLTNSDKALSYFETLIN